MDVSFNCMLRICCKKGTFRANLPPLGKRAIAPPLPSCLVLTPKRDGAYTVNLSSRVATPSWQRNFRTFSRLFRKYSIFFKTFKDKFSRCLTDELTMRDANFALVMVGDADFGPSDARKKNTYFAGIRPFLVRFSKFLHIYLTSQGIGENMSDIVNKMDCKPVITQ